MLNCDGKSPKKLVKHADITKFRQPNILESFLRPGTKVTLIFFQFVHVLQRRNNGSVGKTVVPLGRICPLQNFTFGIRWKLLWHKSVTIWSLFLCPPGMHHIPCSPKSLNCLQKGQNEGQRHCTTSVLCSPASFPPVGSVLPNQFGNLTLALFHCQVVSCLAVVILSFHQNGGLRKPPRCYM